MHSFARHRHSGSGEASPKETKGLILNLAWRYDLMEWFYDTFLFHGHLRQLRLRTVDLARIQPGEQVLDVGCGTGTLALLAQQRAGATGRVVGVDPGAQQIARARAKAGRRSLTIEFQTGVIEQLAFPAATFDVVLSTIMMHHLSDSLKRQGLAEIARVLKPEGRLVIADFKRPPERPDQPSPFGTVKDLPGLVGDAGFSRVETEAMPFPRFPAGVEFVKAVKTSSADSGAAPDERRAAESPRLNVSQPGETQSSRPGGHGFLRLVALALLIVLVVNLHAVGAVLLSKTGFSAFLPHNLIGYLMLGLLLVIAMIAVKHLFGFRHRAGDHPSRGISSGASRVPGKD